MEYHLPEYCCVTTIEEFEAYVRSPPVINYIKCKLAAVGKLWVFPDALSYSEYHSKRHMNLQLIQRAKWKEKTQDLQFGEDSESSKAAEAEPKKREKLRIRIQPPIHRFLLRARRKNKKWIFRNNLKKKEKEGLDLSKWLQENFSSEIQAANPIMNHPVPTKITSIDLPQIIKSKSRVGIFVMETQTTKEIDLWVPCKGSSLMENEMEQLLQTHTTRTKLRSCLQKNNYTKVPIKKDSSWYFIHPGLPANYSIAQARQGNVQFINRIAWEKGRGIRSL